MKLRNILTLLTKDLKLHRWPLLYYAATAAAYPLLLFVGVREIAGATPDNSHLHPFSIAPVALLAVALFPLLASQWLVGSEKTKRTLFLTCLLPIKPSEIAFAKTLVALVMSAMITLACLIPTTMVTHLRPELAGNTTNFITVLICLLVLIFIVQVTLVLQLRFDQRLAFQLPFCAILLAGPLWSMVTNGSPEIGRALIKAGAPLSIFILVVAIPLLQASMAHAIGHSDWSRQTNE